MNHEPVQPHCSGRPGRSRSARRLRLRRCDLHRIRRGHSRLGAAGQRGAHGHDQRQSRPPTRYQRIMGRGCHRPGRYRRTLHRADGTGDHRRTVSWSCGARGSGLGKAQYRTRHRTLRQAPPPPRRAGRRGRCGRGRDRRRELQRDRPPLARRRVRRRAAVGVQRPGVGPRVVRAVRRPALRRRARQRRRGEDAHARARRAALRGGARGRCWASR